MLLRFIRASCVVVREPTYLHPRSILLELTDEKGEAHNITGTIKASASLSLWPNAVVPVCLTMWEYNGRTGYGDTQDAQWTDFTYGMFGKG